MTPVTRVNPQVLAVDCLSTDAETNRGRGASLLP